jgi:hypothetical protein
MFSEAILVKYKNYLKRSYGILGFLKLVEKFAFFFLVLILFNAYEFAYFFPGMKTFIETQIYFNRYWLNIILMSAGALLITLFLVICSKFLEKKPEFNLISTLEETFPKLRTKLSTAYDNKQVFNVVTDKLFNDVNGQLKNLDIKKIIPKDQIIGTFVIFIIISGAIIYCISQGFSFDIYPSKLAEKVPNPHNNETSKKEEETVKETKYNVEAVITKNGEKIEMEINPSLGLGFTNQIDASRNSNFNESANIPNKDFRYSQTYSENLPEDYEPLIKKYFEKLSS